MFLQDPQKSISINNQPQQSAVNMQWKIQFMVVEHLEFYNKHSKCSTTITCMFLFVLEKLMGQGLSPRSFAHKTSLMIKLNLSLCVTLVLDDFNRISMIDENQYLYYIII